MFRLTNKLAISNLIKNRKLYYPFALSVILAVTISYLFYSLAFNPKIVDLRGASAIQFTLQLGLVVVTFASAIIVLYANSFVMKNRSKELGVYGMLGLEKRHLIGMTFKELLIFGLVTVTAGIGIGALFDNLIFALLLKLAKMKVELVATNSTFIFASFSSKAKIRLSKRAPIPIPAVTVTSPNIKSSLKVIPIKWRFSKPNMPYTPSSFERFFMTKLLA